MVGGIKDIEIDSESSDEEEVSDNKFETAAERKKNNSNKSVFSMFK